MAKNAAVRVDAHHNNEDFRSYKISFKDRTDKHANLINGLKLAIKRESDWSGWFECYGELEGSTLKEVNDQVDTKFGNGKIGLMIIAGSDHNDLDEVVADESKGLVIWIEKDRDNLNVGFGIAHASEGKKATLDDTDKYENRWVYLTS